jgi:hypothetical protein
MPLDHRTHQVAERGTEILTATRVHGRGLHHRTARRHQPMKAFAGREQSDGAGPGSACAKDRNGCERAANQFQVCGCIERQQGGFIE